MHVLYVYSKVQIVIIALRVTIMFAAWYGAHRPKMSSDNNGMKLIRLNFLIFENIGEWKNTLRNLLLDVIDERVKVGLS